MDRQQNATSGLMVVVSAALAAALAYWIFSADEAKTLPFAIAQYVLLASVMVGGFGGLVPRRVAR
jgi:CBS domain containing-hemolysin-like protein